MSVKWARLILARDMRIVKALVHILVKHAESRFDREEFPTYNLGT
jgi:hypothetical protein